MNQYQTPVQRPYGYLSPQHYEQLRHKKPLRRWATIIGLGLILNFAIQMILGGIWGNAAFAISSSNLNRELLSLIDQSVVLLIRVCSCWPVTLFIVAWVKIPAGVAFPLRRPRLAITLPGVFVCIAASVLASYLTGLLSMLIEAVFRVYPIPPDFSPPAGLGANIVYAVGLTLIPAIFEELLFRGAIMQSLRRFGDGFAIVVSAILFGLMHGSLTQLPGAFLVGLLLGYFVVRTGSLLPAMLAHLANNGLAVAEIYISGFLNNRQLGIMSFSILAGSILLGAIALFFLAVRVGGLFRVAPPAYPLPASKKASAFFLSPSVIVFVLIILVVLMVSMAPVW